MQSPLRWLSYERRLNLLPGRLCLWLALKRSERVAAVGAL